VEFEICISNIIIPDRKPMSIIKKEAEKLIDTLPEQATWDDIMYEFYIKKKLTVALKAADQGNVTDHEEVKKRLLSK
jgi:predicted transcriptional regulator